MKRIGKIKIRNKKKILYTEKIGDMVFLKVIGVELSEIKSLEVPTFNIFLKGKKEYLIKPKFLKKLIKKGLVKLEVAP